jgi:rifampicin phosphotransferase
MLIFNVGALLSHAVIVSRELAIPCVVSVTDATLRIPNRALIEVDGTSGAITIIEMP